MEAALVIGGIIAVLLAAKKNKGVDGIGAVLWDYATAEIESAGIDLRKNFFELSWSEVSEVKRIGKKFGYRSANNDRSYARNFWYAVKRKTGYFE